ncbi:MAG: acyclic terpene utilization AtuA family protein [Acutalibacter sp.]|jgi:hypothetical protein
MKQIRIGSGAGYAGDRIEPAIDLIHRGNLDYIIFECLAERTISIAQKKKRENPSLGYNDLLEDRLDAILDAWKDRPVKVITNMGAANPKSAAEKCRQMARDKGISGLSIAWVSGDDVGDRLGEYMEYSVMETGRPLKDIHGEVLSANGYIGAQGIVDALSQGADIVITGRVADPALVVGPLAYEFGWSFEDYDHLGKATLVGHLLECAGQVTGGYFADPGYKDVPELWNLGFPIAIVEESGDAVITKLEGTGGLVTEDTVKEQMLYEIQDPASYFTPDVTADFSHIRAEQDGPDRVKVSGATGRKPNGFFKTSVGYHDCYIGEGQISYGGSNALARAQLAKEVLEHRFALIGLEYSEIRYDFMGVNSLYRDQISQGIREEAPQPVEVRLRVAARCADLKQAQKVGNEVEALYTNGPCGGGGAVKAVKDIISIASILIPREDFPIGVHFVEE